MKRLFDIAVAGTGLIFGAPIVGLLAVAVKLDSDGPALFAQTRVGRDGRPFRLLKLRTMRPASSTAPQITAANDNRITRVGKLLRKTKLDELPQLWNVLRGDMSIVGPRPEVPRYVELYRPEWKPLLSVRPGLTDVASLRFRDEEGLLALASDRERAYTDVIMPMKLGLALEGIDRSTVLSDIGVIAKTIAAIWGRSSEDPVVQRARDAIDELNRRGLR